mgnify:CR=1 FL=1
MRVFVWNGHPMNINRMAAQGFFSWTPFLHASLKTCPYFPAVYEKGFN